MTRSAAFHTSRREFVHEARAAIAEARRWRANGERAMARMWLRHARNRLQVATILRMNAENALHEERYAIAADV